MKNSKNKMITIIISIVSLFCLAFIILLIANLSQEKENRNIDKMNETILNQSKKNNLNTSIKNEDEEEVSIEQNKIIVNSINTLSTLVNEYNSENNLLEIIQTINNKELSKNEIKNILIVEDELKSLKSNDMKLYQLDEVIYYLNISDNNNLFIALDDEINLLFLQDELLIDNENNLILKTAYLNLDKENVIISEYYKLTKEERFKKQLNNAITQDIILDDEYTLLFIPNNTNELSNDKTTYPKDTIITIQGYRNDTWIVKINGVSGELYL